MKRFLISGMIGLFAQPLLGQSLLTLAAEGAINLDFYSKRFDEGKRVISRPALSGSWGVNLRGQLSTNFFWEAQAQRKYYSQMIEFSNYPEARSSDNVFNAYLFGLGAGSSFRLIPQRLHLLTSAGYCFGVNTNAGDGIAAGRSELFNSNTGIIYEYDYITDPTLQSRFHLAYLNTGIDYKVLEKLWLSFRLCYHTGFARLVNQDLTYSISNSSPSRARLSSEGDFLALFFGLRIPLQSSAGDN